MQNIPCEVLAYLRFSIFFLQFRHRKQVAQKACSPVRIARSSILLPHALQLYVQLLQMSDPSPRRRRLASESRRVAQVLQRKQSICQRLPAGRDLVYRHRNETIWDEAYRVRKPCLPPRSTSHKEPLVMGAEPRIGGMPLKSE